MKAKIWKQDKNKQLLEEILSDLDLSATASALVLVTSLLVNLNAKLWTKVE